MKVLIDECLDPRISSQFRRHEATSVKAMGWLGKSNGELLELAQSDFDSFLTIDRRLPHQQNLGKFELAIVVVRLSSNDPRMGPEMVESVESLLDSQPDPGVHWVELP